MRREVAALIWLRWRLLMNALRGRRHEGRFETLARYSSAAVPVLMSLAYIPAALLLGFVGLGVGYAMASSGTPVPGILFPRLAFGLVTAAMLVTPLIRSMTGWSTSATSSDRACEPWLHDRPAIGCSSFAATGRPSSGSASPAAYRPADAFASTRASS